MMSKTQIEVFFDRLGIPEAGRRYIRYVRERPPDRVVHSSPRNTTARYPSRKMGWTVQAESVTVELPFVYSLEVDDDVLEYFAQPRRLKISYRHRDGKHVGFFHTPDYLVIRKNAVEIVECKPIEKMTELHANAPERYCQDGNGTWRCPPGEAAAARRGLDYLLWTNDRVTPVYVRNVRFLMDYLVSMPPEADAEWRETIQLMVRDNPGVYLDEVLGNVPSDYVDTLYTLVANGEIYVDLDHAPLGEPDVVRIYPDKTSADAHRNMYTAATPDMANDPFAVDVVIGNTVLWDDKPYRVLAMDAQTVALIDTEGQGTIDIAHAQYVDLAKRGKIVPECVVDSLSERAWDILNSASPEEMRIANYRYACILADERGQPLPAWDGSPPAARTLRRWKRKKRLAEDAYGNGFLGLIPRAEKGGNRSARLIPEMETRMTTAIKELFESPDQMDKGAVYKGFVMDCRADGYIDDEIPSYTTFLDRIQARSGPDQERTRHGRKAAYQREPVRADYEGPRQGDRPFELVHFDHTPLDVQLRCSTTGALLGRPWASFATDGYSRRLLAVYLTFEPPSYRSCMMLSREIVRRFHRLPQTIVVDGGTEFGSVYFDSLLAMYGVEKRVRAGNPKGGSVVERLFDTSNENWIHAVLGSTQLMTNVREVGADVDPQRLAVWTLPAFYRRLTEWAYTVYDQVPHRRLGQSPRDAYAYGMERSGYRTHRFICYDDFRDMSLPLVSPNGTRLVRERVGVQNMYVTYWSDMFNDNWIGETVRVRYDPFNIGVVKALLGDEWEVCRSRFKYILQYRTERELQIASEAIRQRQRNGRAAALNDFQIAEFLRSVKEEGLALTERWRALENRHVLAAINEGVAESGMPADIEGDDEENQAGVTDWSAYADDDIDAYPEY
jgi:transposase InsO family protein